MHESGHVLTAMLTPWAHPVHKATIIPRGSALGWVSQVQLHRILDLMLCAPVQRCRTGMWHGLLASH